VSQPSIEILQRVPLFADLEKRELAQIASSFKAREYAAGDTLATEGEGGVGFFLIESGEATVSVRGQEIARLKAGDSFGEFSVGGRNVLVLVCADFWYSDLILKAEAAPDIILVPALSVSRKPDPYYSRALWRHLAVTRAYEFGAYVGISDWDEGSVLPKYRTSGVAGLADPVMTVPGNFFSAVDAGGAGIYELDFTAIEAFREDRRMRGFFWK